MKELNHEEELQTAGGATSWYNLSFTLKVYEGDTWINSFPYMVPSHEFISSFKRSVSNSCRGASPDQIHLYRPDGMEMVSGSLESNGIQNGDVITAVF